MTLAQAPLRDSLVILEAVTKRRFLVNYDYGMGGVWAFVLAESEEDLVDRFPELTVVTEPPDWLTESEAKHLADTLTVDIDDPQAPILKQLLDDRG